MAAKIKAGDLVLHKRKGDTEPVLWRVTDVHTSAQGPLVASLQGLTAHAFCGVHVAQLDLSTVREDTGGKAWRLIEARHLAERAEKAADRDAARAIAAALEVELLDTPGGAAAVEERLKRGHARWKQRAPLFAQKGRLRRAIKRADEKDRPPLRRELAKVMDRLEKS